MPLTYLFPVYTGAFPTNLVCKEDSRCSMNAIASCATLYVNGSFGNTQLPKNNIYIVM